MAEAAAMAEVQKQPDLEAECKRSMKLFVDFDHGGQNDELEVVQGVKPEVEELLHCPWGG
ncbi:granule-bound starch synthase [Pyrus ussuriensis x Pyrus communis]|uniref:Granule-bound starch synthase n=1 Tax=Pyrus ussuriensis x Pyrus communis TaxID=2448454 RepID=A0A5N5GBE4_9ROSA|nr:granule-bound starch synthase [Pyrus ussuriensis x Pyrus communis]KAB2599711.1 granule-bound starch synthase [Pyrus ussuriensis x Pyrus communis]KAB2603769.1 granule-bound starch synthase [Pyrus ussuriensis x Pyrus communis]KAB2608269.1 granule-bound starch synthase [Pyrus ussuriensis x Pyrus communis]KAB2611081.1 granule-bound starch synthase [Pyrus ussuriensis x Pyrus communis]